MGSPCIESILHNLKLLEVAFDGMDNELEMLKLDLKFLRTFLLCSEKCRRELFSESGKRMHPTLWSSVSRIKDAVSEMKQISEDAVRKRERNPEGADSKPEQRSYGGFKSGDVKKLVSDFREIISSFKEESRQGYAYLSDSSHCASLRSDELVEITKSLLENVSDLKWSRPYDQAFFMVRDHDKILGEFIEAIDGKLTFFTSLIRYVTWRGVEREELENLLTHFQEMVVNAARATYMSWFDRFDKMILIMEKLQEIRPNDPRIKEDNKLVPELLEKLKLDDLKHDEMYIQVLTAPTSLQSLRSFPLDTLVAFVGSLHVHLFELLNYVDHSVHDKMQIVHEGLRFLINFLSNQQKRYNELSANMKDLIQVVVNDAGILICSFSVNRSKEVPDEGMDVALLELQGKIKLMTAEIEPIKNDTPEVDLNECQTEVEKAVKISSDGLPQRSNPVINEIFVGFFEELQQIIDHLTRGSKQLKAVTIWGMPGIGKTTLAKKVHNDSSTVHHFHLRAWCCVSQVYSKKNLLIEILRNVVPEYSNQWSAMDEGDLALQLYQGLKGRRYLIVLDDIWNIEAWNALVESFPNDNNGSRILLTSRMALQINDHDELIFLRQLSHGESWELLQRKLFPKQAFPHKLHDIGMQISKDCNGLPLSIVIVAGILATKEHDSWEKISTSLRSDMVCGTEMVKNILELSYVNLSDCLKKCFLYFGAFPEDQEIPLWKLTCLWIAEGLVQNDDSRSLEDLAKDCIMDLVGRSLVTVGRTSSTEGVKTCRVHDLLHEFCVVKAKEESYIKVIRGSSELLNLNDSGSTFRLCIHSPVKDFQMARLFCPRIPSLLFFPLGYVPQLCNISFIFHICKLLRVLDLEQIVIGNAFPSEIELLVELRYLAIHGDIEYIPSSISKLLNLETFRVKVFYLEALLPSTIYYLKKLRHLVGLCKLDDYSLLEHNLEVCPSLDYLDTLHTLTLSNGPAVDKVLRKFPNIRRLKCRILETVNSSKDHERIVGMEHLLRLESLKLFLGPSHVEFLFPDNLKKVTLEGFCWSIVPIIGKLPNLEVLKLHRAYGEIMWEMEEGEFPKLKTLKLGYLSMVGWRGSGDDLPCLKKLVLERMWKFCEPPCCLKDSSTLEAIEVRWCHQPSVVNLAREIEEEQKSLGNEDFRIIILGGN